MQLAELRNLLVYTDGLMETLTHQQRHIVQMSAIIGKEIHALELAEEEAKLKEAQALAASQPIAPPVALPDPTAGHANPENQAGISQMQSLIAQMGALNDPSISTADKLAGIDKISALMHKANTHAQLQAAAPVPTPAPKVSGGPTPKKLAPTPAQGLSVEEMHAEFMKNFTGNGGVFARFLSPAVVQGGKGMIAPGYYELGDYQEDLGRIPAATLETWPDGFYTNAVNGGGQLLVHTEFGTVGVTGLPSDNHVAVVVKKGTGNVLRVSELEYAELPVLLKALEAKLRELSHFDQVQ